MFLNITPILSLFQFYLHRRHQNLKETTSLTLPPYYIRHRLAFLYLLPVHLEMPVHLLVSYLLTCLQDYHLRLANMALTALHHLMAFYHRHMVSCLSHRLISFADPDPTCHRQILHHLPVDRGPPEHPHLYTTLHKIHTEWELVAKIMDLFHPIYPHPIYLHPIYPHRHEFEDEVYGKYFLTFFFYFKMTSREYHKLIMNKHKLNDDI